MSWDNSHRKSELPANWNSELRPKARARAHGQCEHHDADGVRCPNPGTELHHTGDRYDHRLEVLQWICRPCHKAETQAQSVAARSARHTDRKRPAPRHPGD